MERTAPPKILCTIGPATLNRRCLVKMEQDGVWLFRINLSHTRLEELPGVISEIQSCSRVPICIDTEGAQLRTGYLKGGRRNLPAGSLVVVGGAGGLSANPDTALARLSAEMGITLNHPEVLRDIEIGEMIYLRLGSTSVQVIDKLENDELLCRVVIGGTVGSNKAVDIQTPLALPAMTEKDRASIQIGREFGVKHFALSFAQSAEDVRSMRAEVGDDAFLISKVESNRGLMTLDDIIRESDAILIDRGDLSREQAISRIPFWQKRITHATKEGKKELYVATNLLESMITSSLPTRAEVNDIANTLLDGADGLVLAAETAIGGNPLAAVGILKSVIEEYEKFTRGEGPRLEDAGSRLIPPHGGSLCLAPRLDRKALPMTSTDLPLRHTQYLDFLQLANGVFSPVRGFMTKAEVESVLSREVLLSGALWPVPILLQVPGEVHSAVEQGERVALKWQDSVVGTLTVGEKYEISPGEVCERLFGSRNPDHPGVETVMEGGGFVLAGDIEIVDDVRVDAARYEVTPLQSRSLFEMKGWSQVVGFHTRTLPNLAHEFIQKRAFARTFADGLFVSPVSGPVRDGEFGIAETTRCYNELTTSREYENLEVVIGSFPTHTRYAGVREVVFDALCHQNHGCTHFVAGPEHGEFAAASGGTESSSRMDELQKKMEVRIVTASRVYYCDECGSVTDSCTHSSEHHHPITGSLVSEVLRGGGTFRYPMVSGVVREFLAT
ncbi:MAG: pyruvate kinase [Gemmatimonadota bacterium]|nr:pyruvate kinase [Gemmatimonadota bacterium]